MPFELPSLPYAEDALEPHYSARTISFHYGKHHKSYVAKLNHLTAGSALENSSLEAIIRETAGDEGRKALFNNAAQIWNHTFFWNAMRPGGGGRPGGALAEAVDRDFGSYQGLAEALTTSALQRFGSGWAWLSVDGGGSLVVESTANQDNPLSHGNTPILGVDVWEHAYYLNYQNRRPDYLAAWFNVINWDAVAERFANAG